MTQTHRIVVYTADLGFAVRKGIVEMGRALPDARWLIVLQQPRRPIGRLVRNQWANLMRNGWRWIPYTLADIGQRMMGRPLPPAATHAPGQAYERVALTDHPGVAILEVGDLHAAETLERVKAFAPDIGIALSAPILRRALFAIPRLGTVNLHKGKVPDYRGMPPAFWELWNNEQSVGCTVHWVDDKLDTGQVVAETSVERARHSTLKGLQLQLDEVGVVLMRDAVASILEGRAASRPQSGTGRTNRKPTLSQVAELRRRVLSTHPAGGTAGRRFAKDVGSSIACALWQTGLHRLAAPRVTVLLYHRVSDDARDNLTVGIEQFDRQMALLRRHCEPVSIEDVLAWQEVPRSVRPLVAVNFDDGYLDNCVHAVPILIRHRIPAAFFVSTGIVGSDLRFPHDIRRGNSAIPTMTWDQLRAMRRQGFTIGSHTVNHIDCAGEDEVTVRRELAQSREDLRRELGIEEAILAYPYGGRQHMTPDRLVLVKEAGYVACLSAYGGTNRMRVDRFDVLRKGINWQFSDAAFRFECLGLR